MMLSQLLSTLLIFTLPTITKATCSVAQEVSCSAINFTATSNIFFYVNRTESNKDNDTYNVTITYHWGPENITVGPQAYNITQPYGLSNTYQYVNEGYYKTGYTVKFEDDAAAACSGRSFGYDSPDPKSTILRMERTPNSCEWGAETPNPTFSPTISSGPTMSLSPTNVPVAATMSGGSERNCKVVGLFFLGLVGAVGSLLI